MKASRSCSTTATAALPPKFVRYAMFGSEVMTSASSDSPPMAWRIWSCRRWRTSVGAWGITDFRLRPFGCRYVPNPAAWRLEPEADPRLWHYCNRFRGRAFLPRIVSDVEDDRVGARGAVIVVLERVALGHQR